MLNNIICRNGWLHRSPSRTKAEQTSQRHSSLHVWITPCLSNLQIYESFMLAGAKCPHLGHSELSSRSVPVCDNRPLLNSCELWSCFPHRLMGTNKNSFQFQGWGPSMRDSPCLGPTAMATSKWAKTHEHQSICFKAMIVLPSQALTIMKQSVNLKLGFLLKKEEFVLLCFLIYS